MALRDQEAAGSNPVTPMRKTAKTLSFGGLLIFAFSGLTTERTIDRAEVGETVFLVCSALVFYVEDGIGAAFVLRGFSLSSAREIFRLRAEFSETVSIYDLGVCSSVPFPNKYFFIVGGVYKLFVYPGAACRLFKRNLSVSFRRFTTSS